MVVAKGQKRSNREAKKPKADKKKLATGASTVASTMAKSKAGDDPADQEVAEKAPGAAVAPGSGGSSRRATGDVAFCPNPAAAPDAASAASVAGSARRLPRECRSTGAGRVPGLGRAAGPRGGLGSVSAGRRIDTFRAGPWNVRPGRASVRASADGSSSPPCPAGTPFPGQSVASGHAGSVGVVGPAVRGPHFPAATAGRSSDRCVTRRTAVRPSAGQSVRVNEKVRGFRHAGFSAAGSRPRPWRAGRRGSRLVPACGPGRGAGRLLHPGRAAGDRPGPCGPPRGAHSTTRTKGRLTPTFRILLSTALTA